MSAPLLAAAFAMGFFGSPHCLGMCGGIVTAFGLSMNEVSPLKKRGLIATYHFGRLISYSILGVIAGLIGTKVLEPLMMGNATPRILLGVVLVIIGLSMLGLRFLNSLEKVGARLWKKLAPVRQKVFPLTTFPRALTAGLLWGFLPCGLVYGALLMAVVGGSVSTAALIMFAFGLGTVPMLVATQETVGWLHKQIGKFRLRQINGVIMILSGLAVIALPMLMKNMHHGHMQHSHQAMVSNNTTMNHLTMNHEGMDHEGMDHSNMESHAPMSHDSEPHTMTNDSHHDMSHSSN